jgi:hypothetical protein
LVDFSRRQLAIVGAGFMRVNSFVAPDKIVATEPAAKFLSGWKKNNSDFKFSSDRDPQIAPDFHNFSRKFRTAHRVLECRRVGKHCWFLVGNLTKGRTGTEEAVRHTLSGF